MGLSSLEHLATWLASIALGLIWLSRVVAAARYMPRLAEITRSEFDADPLDESGHPPRVSIVVPARNEAEHIEAALRSLLQLEYPEYEVIAVNDRSTDDTGAIMDRLLVEWQQQETAGAHPLRIIHVEQLPAGWLGKTHAMWAAARQATGKWILFTDADVVFRTDALRRAILYGERERADHMVVFPTMVMKGLGERMMMAFFQSQFVFVHRPWKVADPKARDHMGVGAFNLIRGEVYEAIGTYERLRLAVLDDMKLGELVKQHGYRQRNVLGRDLLRLRWVVGTLGLVRNLTKNFFAILRFNPVWVVVAIGSILIVNVGPFIGASLARGWMRVGFVLALLSILWIYVEMSRKNNICWLCFLLHPVSALLLCYAALRSMVVTVVHGGVVWRGTWYSLEELKEFSRESQ